MHWVGAQIRVKELSAGVSEMFHLRLKHFMLLQLLIISSSGDFNFVYHY